MSEKSRILIICSHYLPGGASAGGTRTVVNTVERLSDEYEFHIITRGWDVDGDTSLYKNVSLGEWMRVGKAYVYYLRSDLGAFRSLKGALESLSPVLVYSNSFFSPLSIFGVIVRRVSRKKLPPFVISPCGEFSPGALAMKRLKKKAYLIFARLFQFYRGVVWRASTEREAADIQSIGLGTDDVRVAPDLPSREIMPDYDLELKPSKEPGKVRLVFLSRIDRIKNLGWILEQLRFEAGAVSLDVFGSVNDESYLRELKLAAGSGKHGIDLRFMGAVPNDRVPGILFSYDFMLLPTLGENFAHVILESLASGCPPIISDRTPWLDLEERSAGWVIPLEDPNHWQRVIDECILMDDGEYRIKSTSARKYAVEFLEDPSVESMTRELFGLTGS